ncbi:MAG: diguanylate cyclase, partial [Armatimonadota bacterium]
LSLAMIDMNNFKLFNDTYGHLAGDQVLRQVAEALSIETPQGGHLARYGGDEYAAALPGCGEGEMVELAERARERLLSIGFVDPNGTKVPIELSFGIAGFPSDATFRHDLINIADQNLYEAKASGGGIRWASDHERQNRALRAHASFETLDALVSAVDNKDRYTRKHSEDVTEYALWIADALGYSEDAKRTIRRAGLLHDVGKIGVPDSILRKPGQLSAEEFEIVQRHPRLGELIVSAIPGMEDIVDAVRSHHERYDGGGYPDRLAAEMIPVIGRLLAVADAFSAMTTDRPYRKGMAMGEASARLLAGIG